MIGQEVPRHELIASLKESSDKLFFDHLEKHVKHTISLFTRNVLMLNVYNTANTLSTFDETSFQEIEDFT